MTTSNNITLPIMFPVTCHTKYVGHDTTFIAIKGHYEDGVRYISQALQKGATTIIVSCDAIISNKIKKAIQKNGATLKRVTNTRLELAYVSAHASNYAHKKLKIIGITGTKGKTSTAFILEHILKNSGYKTALISTVYNKIADHILPSTLTTDQPDYLHQFFALCVKQNVTFVIMEVAAQALSLHRVAGLLFDEIIFTNFDQEHAEFYDNIHNYFKAKCSIFEQLKPNASIFLNADDQWCNTYLFTQKKIISFGKEKKLYDLSATIQDHIDFLACTISHNNKPDALFTCPSLIGAFNSYNLLGAVGVAIKIGIPLEICAKHIKTFSGIPGRLELHTLQKGTRCFIDYAHNPSSIQAVLSALQKITDNLIVVFGAGGERDKIKRPIMGNIASKLADIVFVTSDNPRSEDPNVIIEDIISGISTINMHKIHKIPDRKLAIERACAIATPSSIIAILGKGPDEYQIIGKNKIKFSEKDILASF